MDINIEINPRFEGFLDDWNYKRYLLFGGYGSSKSYHIALKIVLKCLQENRKVLVVREVYETIRESCFDLFEEILDKMDLLENNPRRKKSKKVLSKTSPMSFKFPNGSKIIFKGMDKPAKLKSINGVSIIWVEEASEVKYEGYKELLGRLRHPTKSLHMILSWNPVDEQNWTYKHFFIDDEKDRVILEPQDIYEKKTLVVRNTYYHHSVPEDNLFLTTDYLKQLDEMKDYDIDLWRVAKLGQYGANGLKVLPQVCRESDETVDEAVAATPEYLLFNGLDFGFETSYNALVRCAIDEDNMVLYVYDEVYKNHLTDTEFMPYISYLKNELITADNEDPKAIKFYNLSGFWMAKCRKFAGSRLSNTRKVKRFKRIVIAERCKYCWKELKDLTYKKKPNGELIYDEFNIDPHTFSAIWYALDKYEVPDLKELSKAG